MGRSFSFANGTGLEGTDLTGRPDTRLFASSLNPSGSYIVPFISLHYTATQELCCRTDRVVWRRDDAEERWRMLEPDNMLLT